MFLGIFKMDLYWDFFAVTLVLNDWLLSDFYTVFQWIILNTNIIYRILQILTDLAFFILHLSLLNSWKILNLSSNLVCSIKEAVRWGVCVPLILSPFFIWPQFFCGRIMVCVCHRRRRRLSSVDSWFPCSNFCSWRLILLIF